MFNGKKIFGLFMILVVSLLGLTTNVFAATPYEGRIHVDGGANALIDNNHNLLVWGKYGRNYDSNGNETGIARVNKPTVKLSDVVQAGISSDKMTEGFAALKSDHSLWTWGNNPALLRDLTYTDADNEPKQVMTAVQKFQLGFENMTVLKNDGTLWAWGYVGDRMIEPTKVTDNVKDFYGVIANHVLKNDGTLWNREVDFENPSSIKLTQVSNDVKKVCSNYFIKNDNSVWKYSPKLEKVTDNVTDANDNFILKGTTLYTYPNGYSTFEPVEFDTNVKNLCPGGVYIKNDNSLWKSGMNISDWSYFPQKIMDNVADAAQSGEQGLAITTDGKVYTWGINNYGQIGNGKEDPDTVIYEPTQILSGYKPFDGSTPSQPTDPDTPDQPDTPVTPDKPDNPQPETTVTIYRLFNNQTGEHLYTSGKQEADQLAANPEWNGEGIGWIAPATGEPVYRLFNTIDGGHLYTTNMNEVNKITKEGWDIDNAGQPIFYSGGSVPVYRLFNPIEGGHLFTINENEYNSLPAQNWNQEDVALYALQKGN